MACFKDSCQFMDTYFRGDISHVQIRLDALLDPLPFLPGNNVTGHKVTQFRIFHFHEIEFFPVLFHVKPSTFTADCFCDKHIFPVESGGGGMVLDHLHVSHRKTVRKKRGGHISCIEDGACGISEKTVQSA